MHLLLRLIIVRTQQFCSFVFYSILAKTVEKPLNSDRIWVVKEQLIIRFAEVAYSRLLHLQYHFRECIRLIIPRRTSQNSATEGISTELHSVWLPRKGFRVLIEHYVHLII